VKHLGPVVGQLRRLAHVELGDHPRVRHHPRIGGQEARDVLPERHPRGPQRPPEQGGRQVGPAPAQGGHRRRMRGVLAQAAQEPRHHRDDLLRQQRAEPAARLAVGPVQIGRRPAERAGGHHHLQCVDVLRREARGAQDGGEQPGREPLAARDHQVAGARGQLAQHHQPAGQGLELGHRALDLLLDLGPGLEGGGRGHELVAQGPDGGLHLGRLAVAGPLGHLQQEVGPPGGGRAADHQRSGTALHDVGRVQERRSVPERGPTELVDLGGARLAWHGGWICDGKGGITVLHGGAAARQPC
jgi:hypothetical protein